MIFLQSRQINPINLTTAWAIGTLIIKPAYKKLIWSVPSVNNTDMEVVPEPETHKV